MSTALTNARQLWTTNPQRTFSGSTPAEAGGIMEIVMDSTVYTVTIAADGSWSWQPPSPLAEGPHNLSVRTIDRAGNIGAPSLFIVNVDLSAPDQPLIIGVGDDFGDKTGLVGSGQQTDDRTPTLKGVAEPDSIVRLYNAQNQLIGSVKASSNGYWEITPTLADGEHSLYVTATDGRGYVSQASEAFTLTVADDAAIPVPGKVEITHALDDAGAAQGKLLNGALTDDTTPTLRGTAPAGSNVLIQYRDVNGQWVDGGYATLNGTEWSWTPDKALAEGKWEFRAYAGSGWTDEFTLEIDLTPGSELSITHAWDDFGINTGLLHSGAITDDRTPALNGRAEANSIV
ncbi:Ig-like domain-containing protein [Pantoea dispersa]|uniref:Ig-like domain-containing protein n=1 Tax=Pantoea dispersa TaxID=59814 RepID=UPI002DB8F224|nr:Ig-like domain-containing protein [Pantoea dispersa]MEB5972771.1 Ig-like domain-containing protein [Pantoea dispersa]